ncbi:MAG: hypothetical protein WCN95_04700 [bacterium]
MTDTGTDRRHPAQNKHRLLLITVNGKACYASKWSDKREAYCREVNYVLQATTSDEVLCLLIDCPLRIPGSTELVSVQSTERPSTGTGHAFAVTVWDDGSKADKCRIRFCLPEQLHEYPYLRTCFNDMLRDYNDGKIECTDLTRQVPAMSELAHLKPVVSPPMAAQPDQKRIIEQTAEMIAEKIWKKMPPHIAADKAKAQIAWIKRAEGCSDVERKAALLKIEGMTLDEIAARLPHKNGRPIPRQSVAAMLKRFAKKTGNPGLFKSGTHRDNVHTEDENRENTRLAPVSRYNDTDDEGQEPDTEGTEESES